MHTKDLASRCMSQPLDMKKNLMEYVHLGTFIYSKTTPNTFCTCIYFTQCMESLHTDLLVMQPFSSSFYCQPLSPHRNDDTKHIQPVLSDASSFSSLTYPCLLRDHNKLSITSTDLLVVFILTLYVTNCEARRDLRVHGNKHCSSKLTSSPPKQVS